ncbi:MAG: hypothetical protein ACK528_01320, partial [Alphaproteobacteria bacterium]
KTLTDGPHCDALFSALDRGPSAEGRDAAEYRQLWDGAAVFAEHVVVKQAAHALFSSDIPMLHPELIDAAESDLLATARTG